MNRDRNLDRAALPEPMRRDVRLLGDVLGEIIRDSAGPELLADVEQLRHAVIDARHRTREEHRDGDPGHDPAGEQIANLVASWDLDRAEQVARAFTVYFHLVNLAEEHQRIRFVRERDAGTDPVRESLAAAVTEISRDAGQDHLAELLGCLRVHLVLTAHPTEARRRAVVAVLRRINELLAQVDDPRTGAADLDEARRGLRENVDLLWRTVTAAGQGHGPDRRGPHGHGRVRRDAVPGGPGRVPGARPRAGLIRRPLARPGRAGGPGSGPGPAGPRPRPAPRRCRRTCGSAAGWAPTGTGTRS